MFKLFSGLFDSNEKQLNKHRPIVDQVSALEEATHGLSDEALAQTAEEFRSKLGVDMDKARKERDPFLTPLTKPQREEERKAQQQKLFALLPDVFARVREAAKRATGHRHFDVQVLGAVFLSKGYVTELFTGEGKTLAATMPLFLYALYGRGAHLVTVNDYLARRDGEWTGHIYSALGMTVGVINPGASYKFISDDEAIKLKGDDAKKLINEREKKAELAGRLKYDHMSGVNLVQCSKKEAYNCDIVYGTNNEFGFDYLRDNMATSLEQRVQGPLCYAIVDEADSILIDEARTPLIISSPAEESNELYKRFAQVVRGLQPVEDYVVDEKAHSVALTDAGVTKTEKALNVKNLWENYAFAHHLDNALKAKELFKRDDEYLVREGEVLIVDEFTGRVLPGRRYSEGLHQAIEAKEGVEIKKESRTLATITFQNYFRLYDYLAGMTGTALTESEEFAQIYKLEVIVVPPNVPVVRKDAPDLVFRTKLGKFKAVAREIQERNEAGQPVLVGTTSIENSELLSDLLRKEGIPHEVLNAKYHEKEAKIVAQAGQRGQVTIATNMAGRGTDIALGEGVKELGGLHIIGTERHESRRIDNQLRGRAGRQGDPGSSRFYVSFEDDLMRIFGGEALGGIMGRVGMDDDMPIEAGIVGRTIESAQKRVESYHFDTRKHLVEYDDVLNQQREIIYDLRRKILTILSIAAEELSLDRDAIKQDKVVRFQSGNLDSEAVAEISNEIATVTLKDSSTWEVSRWSDDANLSKPLRLWILKLCLQYLESIFAAQLQNDARVVGTEEKTLFANVLDIVPLELASVSVKQLGYNSWEDFEKKVMEKGSPDVQRLELMKFVLSAYILHVKTLGNAQIMQVERFLTLQTIDNLWVEHLDLMTDLREGIGLRGYANRNPLVEYKNEGFSMFEKMLGQIEDSVAKTFFKVQVVKKDSVPGAARARAVHQSPVAGPMQRGRTDDNRPGNVSKQKTVIHTQKVGRNDPCPCGSGKKYKKCCYPKYG